MLLLLLVELLHQFVHFSFQRQDFLVRASVVFHLRLTTVVLFFVLFWGERHWLLVLRIVRKFRSARCCPVSIAVAACPAVP
mgnify:CR=1 FL=1